MIHVFSSQPLSELTGKQIAARADEDDGGKEDDKENADDSEDGPITCKASTPLFIRLWMIFRVFRFGSCYISLLWSKEQANPSGK